MENAGHFTIDNVGLIDLIIFPLSCIYLTIWPLQCIYSLKTPELH